MALLVENALEWLSGGIESNLREFRVIIPAGRNKLAAEGSGVR